MHLAVFGASGRLGREVLRAARERGHSVTAQARTLGQGIQPNVNWVIGDLEDAVREVDVVLILFGPRSPSEPPFCEQATREILGAMQRRGVRRLICVTGAMIGDYPRNRTWCFRRFAAWIQRRYRPWMEDRARQEEAVRRSGAEWTLFKPPRLTMKAPSGRTQAGPEVRVGLLSSVARSDLARLLVEESGGNRFLGEAVFVKG